MKMIKRYLLKKPIWTKFVLKLNNVCRESGLKLMEEPSMENKLVDSLENNPKYYKKMQCYDIIENTESVKNTRLGTILLKRILKVNKTC